MDKGLMRLAGLLALAAALPACGGTGGSIPAAAAPTPYIPWTVQNPANVVVSSAAKHQLYPQIVTDGSGGAIIAWSEEFMGIRSGIYAQRIDSLGVTRWAANGVTVTAPASSLGLPSIISDGAGGAIIAWHDPRNGTFDIYVQRFNSAGVPQWTANGVAICTQPDYQGGPKLAPDGSGGAFIAWSDVRSTTNGDIYAQRVNSSGVPQWTADGVPVAIGAENEQIPEIVAGAAGDVIVVWWDRRNGVDFDLYAQRLNGSGVGQWTAGGVPVCAAAGDQMQHRLIPDESGGAILVWQDARTYLATKGDVYAQRLNSSGTPQWTIDGVMITQAHDFQNYPRLCPDGSGGAIITWEDRRRYNLPYVDVYAQHVNSAGTPQWTADGLPICIQSTVKGAPDIASDGAGGAVIVWVDPRSGTSQDLYAQRVSAAGVTQWTADGVTVSSATAAGRTDPRLLLDGAGGVIAVWADYRNGTHWDLYAQGFDALTGP